MNEHTSGPWHSVSKPEGPNGAGRLWYYAQREPSLSSSCLSVGPFRTQQEADVEAERQNSLLLVKAAAPDLLDVAKRLDDAVGFFLAALPTNHAVAKDLIGLRDVARAAITKAEGGAQ